MLFKDFFLLQESRSTGISEEQFIHFYDTYCSRFNPAKNILFRNVDNSDMSPLFINPANFERNSSGHKKDSYGTNSRSFAQWTMELLPSWSKFPPRSKALICGSTFDVAAFYNGTTHLVIPFDGTTLGICPSEDFFHSFVQNTPELNTRIAELIKNILQRTYNISPYRASDILNTFDRKKYENFLKSINYKLMDTQMSDYSADYLQVQSVSQRHKPHYGDSQQINHNLKQNFLPTLTELLDPIKNGFQSVPLSQYDSFEYRSNDAREVWFANQALMIPFYKVQYAVFDLNQQPIIPDGGTPKQLGVLLTTYLDILRKKYAKSPTTTPNNRFVRI